MGEYTHSLDDKGRLTIPARFRDEMARGVVLTRGYDKNLLLYTADNWAAISARAASLSQTDPQNRTLLRVIFSSAVDSVPDRQGRVVVPAFLREYGGIEAECVIVGVGHQVEIWSKDGWAAQLQILNDAAANAGRFSALNLAPG